MKKIHQFFNWLDKKSQKNEMLWIKFAALCVAISLVGLFVLTIYQEKLSKEVFEVLSLLILLIMSLAILTLPLLAFIRLLIVVKHGIHNLRECDDELFEKIDYFNYGWSDNNTTYMNKIRIINLYYKDGGEVDELVKKKEIVRLFARKSFLSIRNNLSQDLTTCFYSLIISVIASFVFQISQYENSLKILMNSVVIVMIFFMIIFMKYYKRGEYGSYTYQIEEYELELLSEKIAELENLLQADENDEKILRTQQTVLKDLIDKKRKTKNKKKQKVLIEDIEKVEILNLSLEDVCNYQLNEISFNNNVGYIAYSVDENEKINGFATNAFKDLCEIIEKHYKVKVNFF